MLGSSGLATFDEDFAKMRAFALNPVTSSKELIKNLTEIYRIIYHIDFGSYDLARVRTSAPEMMKAVFNLRTDLHDKINDWHQQDLMSKNAQRALRAVFRVTRYAVDMLGELAIGYDEIERGGKSYRAFTGPHMNTLFHTVFEKENKKNFQSGDLLLVRGKRYNSAAIARIGDMDSQFSHLSMIHIDREGRPWVVESLIETGAIITPLDQALEHDLARAVLFRYKDQQLAARASEMIYSHILGTVTGKYPKIPYDFSMRLDNYDQLFCSKLVRFAFDQASNGEVKLPTFHTEFDMRNKDFIERIGVKTIKTFAPGDIEIDPDFHMVAEWRDYRETSALRLHDMIMTKFFEWMDAYNYKFQEDMIIRLIGFFGHASSYLSQRARDLLDDVMPIAPRNMSRKTIATLAMLHFTAQNVFRELYNLERNSIIKTGRPLHPRDIFEHLEYIRQTSDGRIAYLKE